jgi:serine/threonine protein kinase
MGKRGRYKLVKKIADGGMAEIYLGTQHGVEGFERPVVLKRILPALLAEPQFKNLMIDEAHVAMRLQHSNIAQVLDLGEAKGRYYLVLEFVDGWDLNNVINRVRTAALTIPPEIALFIVAEVGRALAYAHNVKRDGKPMGIVHRDVSPHNVLLSEQGEVKLTDFGIAKAMIRRENTVQGVIKGKLAFMSPEQASGVAVDFRSDLFSVGTMLYLMTTGKRPFESPTDLEALLRVQKCDFPPPERIKPDIDPALARFISKAMSARLLDRHASADAMVEEMETLQRSVFQPAGKTELKRWLKTLEDTDGVPSSGRARPPARDPNETMEIEDQDIEFEDSRMDATLAAPPGSRPSTGSMRAGGVAALLAPPAGVNAGSEASAAMQASASPGAAGFATQVTQADRPSGKQLLEPPLSGEEPPTRDELPAARVITPPGAALPLRPRRRGAVMTVVYAGAAAAAGAFVWKKWRGATLEAVDPGTDTSARQDPAAKVPSPTVAAERSPADDAVSAGDARGEVVAESLAPDAAPEPSSANSDPANAGEPLAESDEEAERLREEREEASLLEQAEADIGDKVIGEDPEDAIEVAEAKPVTGRWSRPAPPPSKPRPEEAPVISIKIVSRPSGAVVRLRRRVFGRAPLSLRFRSGITYELSFVKAGYFPATKRFTVSRRKNQTLAVSLRKRPTTKKPPKKKGLLERIFGRR